jgi:hypothetical protein
MELGQNSGQAWMDVILRFLQSEQWSYQVLNEKPAVRAGYRGEHGTWVCYIRIEEEQGRIVLNSLMGLNILPQYRFPVMQYLSRVNNLLVNGKFEIDLDSGDVKFKTSIDVKNGDLKLDEVRVFAYSNVRTMDHYFPGVISVVHGGLTPEAALARVDSMSIADIG